MARPLPDKFCNIEMQARHLTPAELNYELEIREKADVFSSDQEAIDWLQKRIKTEFTGTYQKPGLGASKILPMEELQYCDLALKEIRAIINSTPDEEGIETCISRVKHLFDRLARLVCEPGNKVQAKAQLETAESQLLELIVLQGEQPCPAEQEEKQKELTTINLDETQTQPILPTGAIPKPRRRPICNVADFETPDQSMNFPYAQANNQWTQPSMLNPAYMQALRATATIEDCSDDLDPANTVEAETREKRLEVQLTEIQRQLSTIRLQKTANKHTQQQQRMPNNSTIDPNSRLTTDPHSSPPINTFFVQASNQNGNTPPNRMSSQFEQATRATNVSQQAQAVQVQVPPLLNQRPLTSNNDMTLEGLLQDTTDAHNQQIQPSHIHRQPRISTPHIANLNANVNEEELGYEVIPFRALTMDKWKCYFSGKRTRRPDELGLPDFIKQVEYQTRANKMHPNTVAQQITVLLRSPALEWLTFLPESINTWKELVFRMKEKYLSNDFEFEILADIQSRHQKKGESVTEFVSEIQKMYRSLNNPVNEQLQCHTIQNNLLIEIATAMHAFRFTSVTKLEQCARNIERNMNAYQTAQQKLKSNFYGKKPNRYSKNVNSVDTKETGADQDSETEQEMTNAESSDEDETSISVLKEVRTLLKTKKANSIGETKNNTSDNNSRHKNKSTNSNRSNDDKSTFCWNCEQFGHTFKNCKNQEQRVFCHGCGTPDKYSTTCEHPQCRATRTKNGQAGSQSQQK